MEAVRKLFRSIGMGTGPNGKINNAIQILQDAAQAGATIEQNLVASQAAQNPHPDIAAAASVPSGAAR